MYPQFRERQRMPNRFHDAHVSLRSMHVWRFVSPRLILRNLPFYQSRAQVNVHNDYGPRTQPSTSKAVYKLYRHDWFHNFLRWPTLLSVVFLLFLWTFLTLLFSLLYLVHDKLKTSQTCSLWPPITADDGTLVPTPPLYIYTSFTFALETGTTVGYALPGASQSFFLCPGLQFVIYLNMIVQKMFGAFFCSFLFTRLSRTENRSHQILFSNKAVIRRESTTTAADGTNDRFVLEARVYNMDAKHPVVEERVRMVLVHSSTTEAFRRTNYARLRILSPNDELSAPLFSSIPSLITHHIDSYSPLMPSNYHPKEKSSTSTRPGDRVGSYGLSLREVDCWTGNRDKGIPCSICGVGFSTYGKLWNHIRNYQIMEKSSSMKIEGSHQQLGSQDDETNMAETKPKIPSLAELQMLWAESNMELIVIVEGIDPLMSGSFMALQSYQSEDIVFGARFENCIIDEGTGIKVDYNLFHKIAGVEGSQ